jgi:hypothetical protein
MIEFSPWILTVIFAAAIRKMSTVPENVKNLFWISEPAAEREYTFVPHLYMQAKIDFSDVRTGFNESYNVNRAVLISPDLSEPYWDDDVVREIGPENVGTAAPKDAALRDLPGSLDGQYIAWMETQFIQFLLRAFTVTVYRNYNLDLYSLSGESRNDFIIRCADLHKEPMYAEFDSVHEVYKRQIERLRQKFLGMEGLDELETMKTDSYNRELFQRISDRINGLFLRTEFSIQHFDPPSGPASRTSELEERLRDLYRQAREAVIKILDSYEENIRSVDDYLLHPTVRNIHFVNSCILWMPDNP